MDAKRAIAAVLLVLVNSRSATPEDLLAGLPAEEYWRHQREFAELMPKAMAGDPVAQDRIGAFYDYGFTDQDYRLAALWYRKAARQGSADAEYNLAVLYLGGLGVSEDDHEGVALLRAAAVQGHMIAKRWLGEALIYGYYGLPVDSAAGWQLIRDSAEAGGVRSQLLRASHETGHERMAWLQRAVKFGNAEALYGLAEENEGTPQGLAYLRQAAEAGNSIAMVGLGCAIIDSNPAGSEREEALRWFGQAVDQGQPNAIFVTLLLVQNGAIRPDPVTRVFLASLFDDYLTRPEAGPVDPRRIAPFVAEASALPDSQRDQFRLLRSRYHQRKILFEDLHISPTGAAAGWRAACHTGI